MTLIVRDGQPVPPPGVCYCNANPGSQCYYCYQKSQERTR